MRGATADPPSGLRYEPDALAADEERAIAERLAAIPFREVRMRGMIARRRVLHFGFDYGYDTWKLRPAEPVPDWLEPLRSRAGALAGVAPAALDQVLVARYPAGAGIGWHRDAPMFGPSVVGFSLLAPCTMRLRRTIGERREIYALPLAPRSAYVLGGPARSAWQHAIPPVAVERISITFRTVRDPARWLATDRGVAGAPA